MNGPSLAPGSSYKKLPEEMLRASGAERQEMSKRAEPPGRRSASSACRRNLRLGGDPVPQHDGLDCFDDIVGRRDDEAFELVVVRHGGIASADTQNGCIEP